MNDQRGEIPSLSALLAPSVYLTDEGKIRRLPPTAKYIAALRIEGLHIPEQKPSRLQGPIDADDYTSELQIFYVKLAILRGDWRDMRGTKPTPKMIDHFVTGRALYLAWKKRRDEEEEREAALPKTWFEIEPGRFVLSSSEENARAFAESMKPITTEHHIRERAQIDIDTSKTCTRCKMRRSDPGTTLCGNCISLGYT